MEKEKKLVMRLEFQTKECQEFWEMTLDGKTSNLALGKIGQSNIKPNKKTFSSEEAAMKKMWQLVRRQIAEGFKLKECNFNIFELLDVPSNEIEISGSLLLTKNISDSVMYDLCGWMTLCLKSGIEPKKFKEIWEEIKSGKNLTLTEAVTTTNCEKPEFWFDKVDWDDINLAELYRQAFENEDEAFVHVENHPHTIIATVKGKKAVAQAA